jgi:hypothetical protein
MTLLLQSKAPSEVLRISAAPAAVFKDQLVVIGHLAGIALSNAAAGGAFALQTGRPASVFQVKISDMDGVSSPPTIGDIIYVEPNGDLSTTAASGAAAGTDQVFGTIIGSEDSDTALVAR